jgi:hypothetical protein
MVSIDQSMQLELWGPRIESSPLPVRRPSNADNLPVRTRTKTGQKPASQATRASGGTALQQGMPVSKRDAMPPMQHSLLAPAVYQDFLKFIESIKRGEEEEKEKEDKKKTTVATVQAAAPTHPPMDELQYQPQAGNVNNKKSHKRLSKALLAASSTMDMPTSSGVFDMPYQFSSTKKLEPSVSPFFGILERELARNIERTALARKHQRHVRRQKAYEDHQASSQADQDNSRDRPAAATTSNSHTMMSNSNSTTMHKSNNNNTPNEALRFHPRKHKERHDENRAYNIEPSARELGTLVTRPKTAACIGHDPQREFGTRETWSHSPERPHTASHVDMVLPRPPMELFRPRSPDHHFPDPILYTKNKDLPSSHILNIHGSASIRPSTSDTGSMQFANLPSKKSREKSQHQILFGEPRPRTAPDMDQLVRHPSVRKSSLQEKDSSSVSHTHARRDLQEKDSSSVSHTHARRDTHAHAHASSQSQSKSRGNKTATTSTPHSPLTQHESRSTRVPPTANDHARFAPNHSENSQEFGGKRTSQNGASDHDAGGVRHAGIERVYVNVGGSRHTRGNGSRALQHHANVEEGGGEAHKASRHSRRKSSGKSSLSPSSSSPHAHAATMRSRSTDHRAKKEERDDGGKRFRGRQQREEDTFTREKAATASGQRNYVISTKDADSNDVYSDVLEETARAFGQKNYGISTKDTDSNKDVDDNGVYNDVPEDNAAASGQRNYRINNKDADDNDMYSDVPEDNDDGYDDDDADLWNEGARIDADQYLLTESQRDATQLDATQIVAAQLVAAQRETFGDDDDDTEQRDEYVNLFSMPPPHASRTKGAKLNTNRHAASTKSDSRDSNNNNIRDPNNRDPNNNNNNSNNTRDMKNRDPNNKNSNNIWDPTNLISRSRSVGDSSLCLVKKLRPRLSTPEPILPGGSASSASHNMRSTGSKKTDEDEAYKEKLAAPKMVGCPECFDSMGGVCVKHIPTRWGGAHKEEPKVESQHTHADRLHVRVYTAADERKRGFELEIHVEPGDTVHGLKEKIAVLEGTPTDFQRFRGALGKYIDDESLTLEVQ